jgi:hypothetical protein
LEFGLKPGLSRGKPGLSRGGEFLV